jgi:hypothetical protein
MLTAGVLGPVKWIEVARYSQFADAIEEFLQSQFFQSPVSDAVLAVAGPCKVNEAILPIRLGLSMVVRFGTGSNSALFGLSMISRQRLYPCRI